MIPLTRFYKLFGIVCVNDLWLLRRLLPESDGARRPSSDHSAGDCIRVSVEFKDHGHTPVCDGCTAGQLEAARH